MIDDCEPTFDKGRIARVEWFRHYLSIVVLSHKTEHTHALLWSVSSTAHVELTPIGEFTFFCCCNWGCIDVESECHTAVHDLICMFDTPDNPNLEFSEVEDCEEFAAQIAAECEAYL